jgi:hypothetical protein
MLIVINDSPKVWSSKVRAVIGRYCWKVARDVWVWPKSSIRHEIICELEIYSKQVRVLFIWKDGKKPMGFEHTSFGAMKRRQTSEGLFNHKAELYDE